MESKVRFKFNPFFKLKEGNIDKMEKDFLSFPALTQINATNYKLHLKFARTFRTNEGFYKIQWTFEIDLNTTTSGFSFSLDDNGSLNCLVDILAEIDSRANVYLKEKFTDDAPINPSTRENLEKWARGILSGGPN